MCFIVYFAHQDEAKGFTDRSGKKGEQNECYQIWKSFHWLCAHWFFIAVSFDWKRKFLSPFKIYPIKNSALRHPICCIGDNVKTLTPRIRNILHFHQHILPSPLSLVRLSRQHFSFNKSTIFVLCCQKSTERMAGRNLIDPNGKKNYLGVEGSSLKIDVWHWWQSDMQKTWLEIACCKFSWQELVRIWCLGKFFFDVMSLSSSGIRNLFLNLFFLPSSMKSFKTSPPKIPLTSIPCSFFQGNHHWAGSIKTQRDTQKKIFSRRSIFGE